MQCFIKIKTLFFEFLSKLFKKRTTLSSFIPKEATQQSIFLSKNPEFDGRGIKIAIIDLGIDVSFEGLQKTSGGLPKIIDCFDFTGSGDVDTSVIREKNSEGILIGISGRKFKIPQKWINPSGKWHLGLKSLYKPYKFPATNTKNSAKKLRVIDCIVWNDGIKWLACIGTLTKNLEGAKVLSNFRDGNDYGSITLNGIKLNYCITVHNAGNLLEIFTANEGSHGSLVGEVAAAAYSSQNNPDGEGLAPGAQIISMNVQDPETNFNLSVPALQKALLKCIEMKVDIVNCSLLFPTFTGCRKIGSEEIPRQLNEMSTKHNILIFNSVGNAGPLRGTSSKRDQSMDVIFRIGAILTSDIQKRYFNAPGDGHPPVAYPFSSRGPCSILDDSLPCGMLDYGLEFMAPGGSISSCIRSRNEYAEGTSLSCPNAAGAVACLLSGLKARGIPYSHSTIKFVLCKTALLPETQNQFEFGHGIIQINGAFDYCCKNDLINFKIPSFIIIRG